MLTAAPAPPRAMGVNLVLFFVFALGALVLLTRTLVSVTQLQASVHDAVQPATNGIVTNTALLQKLTVSNQVAGRLRQSGQSVNGALTNVSAVMQRIVVQLSEVRDGTLRIDQSVAGIATSSADVRQLVVALQTSVAATDRTSAQISSGLAGSDRAVDSAVASLHAAGSDLDAVVALIHQITQQVQAISPPLASVDRHLANVYSNGLVQLSNLLSLHDLLPRLGIDGGR